MTPDEEIIRANRARQILEDPLVREAIDEIKSAIIERWRISPVTDFTLREQIWALYNAVFKFEELFHNYIASGKISADNIAFSEQEKALWGNP